MRWKLSVIFRDYGVTIGAGLGYLALHVLLYLLVLRDRRPFQSERGIFLYHFLSATVFTVVALTAAVSPFSDAALAVAIGLIAMHCIYSLSFLDGWVGSADRCAGRSRSGYERTSTPSISFLTRLTRPIRFMRQVRTDAFCLPSSPGTRSGS
jgi:hypothetical protein